ncbi:MAG: NF038122 family metalloprotease, partial [Leptolyngbyaceae cyanobacterium MAG.088]|nr:NF038122 family metalloprotease [Leptolyngbyaceae cyanobacterium MAG.088]
MVQFNFTYDPSISLEQRVGFELAAMIWSSYLTDDITVNLHIASSDSLGEGGEAVGGAIPIFHEQNYGIYQEYAEADATSDTDDEAIESLQGGNTVDLLVGDQVIDGNTDILLTSAQAKALGMDEAITLDNGSTWDRDLVDPNGLDGYIIVSNAFDWNYDYTRSREAPEGTLDFMSMALHEIGHQLGFVSSLDGTLDINSLHSGETQAEGFTILDLFRHSIESTEVENPDGAVSDLTLGQNSYFSIDGGETNLGDFADGLDYQASHWKRLQVAMGIMDPTLAYQERLSLGHLDLQAMDVLGWDINYNTLETGLDLDTLLTLAENKVEASLGLSETALNDSRGGGEHGDMYSLGYSQWWAIFEKHILELGYSQWWSVFELGYSQWWQQHEEGTLELGYSQWWQSLEDTILELGYSQWWQSFEADMLELGYSQWWQLLELGYSQWWQKLETYFSKLDKVNGNASKEKSESADGGVAGQNAKIYRGGENDDIIAGDKKQDRINAGEGDDLIDGKGGHDVIWGEAGDDIIYGHDGNDLIYGGDDDDLILGETHDDELHGEAGHDIVSGGSGDDIVTGGEGKDELKGGWGHDVIDGGDDNDRLEGEAGNDLLIGGAGQDQLNGGGGDDILYGDAYDGNKSLKQLRTQLQEQVNNADSDSVENNNTNNSNTLNPIRVEAENMTLAGDYALTNYSVSTGSTAQLTTTFSGESGNYIVLARYTDEDDGIGTFEFSLNGQSINSFVLDQDSNRYHTRTVAQNITLETGDEFTVIATADGGDNAHLNYLEFIPLDNLLVTPLESTSQTTTSSSSISVTTTSDGTSTTTTSTSSTTSGSSSFRVEAEALNLLGDYVIETNSESSGNALIKGKGTGEGVALTTFGGESGYYNIVVGYYDENDTGIGQISAALNGGELDTWNLDQNLGGTLATSQNFLTRTVASTVLLNQGDVFKLTSLTGISDNGQHEHARIDYIDFISAEFSQDNGNPEPEPIVPSAPVVIGDAIRVEAEDMSLSGYSRETHSNASDGGLIRTSSSGVATTQFAGSSGYYNIVVAYYDENDGLSNLSASLDGVELDNWQLDQNLGSSYIGSNNRVTRTIATQVQINTGDE